MAASIVEANLVDFGMSAVSVGNQVDRPVLDYLLGYWGLRLDPRTQQSKEAYCYRYWRKRNGHTAATAMKLLR